MDTTALNVIWFRYRIKGKHIDTKRKRTITVIAKSEELAQKNAESQGLLEPLEIEAIPFEPATDNQINYAKSLGIFIPDDATKEDLSCLLDCKLEHDNKPNQDLIEYAYNRNIFFSKYIGKRRLYNIVFNSLDDLDKTAFFIFSAYRWLSDDRRGNLDTHPYISDFYQFASKWCNDKKFLKSLNTYNGEDLRFFGTISSIKNGYENTYTAGSNRTFAYTTVSTFLHEKFNTPLTTSKTFNDNNTELFSNQSDITTFNTAKNSTGCLLPILALIVLLSCLILL